MEKNSNPGRIKKILNWLFVLIQAIAIGILASMAFSREYYSSLSESVTPGAEHLFNSGLLDLVLTTPFGYFLWVTLAVLVVKEFVVRTFLVRFYSNIAILVGLVGFLSLVFQQLYQPI